MYGEEEEASDDGGGLCRGRMGTRLKRPYWRLFCFCFLDSSPLCVHVSEHCDRAWEKSIMDDQRTALSREDDITQQLAIDRKRLEWLGKGLEVALSQSR
jgi:hypothetical protein